MSRAALAALLACAAVACAALAGPAGALEKPDGAVYRATAGVVTQVRWTSEDAGYPNRCRRWTRSEGSVRVRASAKGPVVLHALPGVGWTGGMEVFDDGRFAVERTVDYRVHHVGITPDCFPCGPDSAMGECGDPIPDDVGRRGCAPAASRSGTVYAAVKGGTLFVEGIGRSGEVLRECSKLIPTGVPVGPSEPKLLRTRYPGAAARILRLEPGESTRFSRESARGNGCRGRARGRLRTCTTHLTSMTVTRVR
jgi:hypothetical protein